MTEHAGHSYQTIAQRYADRVDSQPIHTHYERPAVLSLLSSLKGTAVLDVGCGSGWYTEYFLGQGASVTAFDLNEDFVQLTRQRVGNATRVLQADLSQPLSFAADRAFDVVVAPLVMHYLKDWQPALSEFHRVLKPQGSLVFSTHYPLVTRDLFALTDYFETARITDEWDGIGEVQFYHNSLTQISQALSNSGFVIERLLEPQPTAEYEQLDPADYQKLSTQPWFLVIKATKRSTV
ncbi:MAG: class I SAM-dependent methyltransferase [Cyanobacteria bacterium J06628_6]